jgi:hypothetical protein
LHGNGTTISQLTQDTAGRLSALLKDQNNPHTLDLLAREIFFTEDKVILVEGQEDAVFLKIVEQQTVELNGTVFGWGVGGADKMERVAAVLNDLGFEKVVGILDGDQSSTAEELRNKFPDYHFFCLPANDIRTKKAVNEKPKKCGLLDDENKSVRSEYIHQTICLFGEANSYLRHSEHDEQVTDDAAPSATGQVEKSELPNPKAN